MGSSTPRPWARGDQTLSGVIKARKDDTAQHRRQTARQVAPKRATPGSMQGMTRARPGSALWTASDVRPSAWTFDTTTDPSPADKPTLQLDGSGTFFGPTEAGWYATRNQMQFTTGGTVTAALIQANSNSSTLAEFGEAWVQNQFFGKWRTAFWCGPFWCDGTSTPLGLQAFWSGSGVTPGSLIGTMVDVWRVG